MGISSPIEGLKSRKLLEVEAIDYTKGFDLKKFGLVISHAGAGTILDTLRSKVGSKHTKKVEESLELNIINFLNSFIYIR